MTTTWTVRIATNPFRPWEGEKILASGVSKREADRLLRKHIGACATPEKKA